MSDANKDVIRHVFHNNYLIDDKKVFIRKKTFFIRKKLHAVIDKKVIQMKIDNYTKRKKEFKE